MPKFAEIKNGVVEHIGEYSIAPDHGGDPAVVDVTSLPAVVEGSTYDGSVFTPPPAPPAKTFETLLTARQFIGIFTFDEWSDVKGSTDTNVQKFVAVLESYPKRFDTGHAKVTAAMTKIVQAGDISINQTRAQEIVKGILR